MIYGTPSRLNTPEGNQFAISRIDIPIPTHVKPPQPLKSSLWPTRANRSILHYGNRVLSGIPQGFLRHCNESFQQLFDHCLNLFQQ